MAMSSTTLLKGSFEHYFLFYEKSLRLLKKSGLRGFIAPVTWLSIPSAQSLPAKQIRAVPLTPEIFELQRAYLLVAFDLCGAVASERSRYFESRAGSTRQRRSCYAEPPTARLTGWRMRFMACLMTKSDSLNEEYSAKKY